MAWLIREDIFQAMSRAMAGGFVLKAEQQLQHEERSAPTAEGMPRNLKIAGDVAEIRVEGALTQKPDFFAWLFGGGNTTYQQIQQALAIAAADPTIKRAVLYVDSPGGHVHGLFDCIAALDAFPKALSVVASQACSAAYSLASVAGKIEGTNEAAEFGSIGVAARYFVSDNVVDVTSTEAPNKRPDVRTDEGKAVVRKELDDIHDLFVDAIAHGRSTTADKVNEKFGRGAVVLAREAKKLGMIDRIAKAALRPVDPADGPSEESDPIDASAEVGGAATEKNMDIELLKKQHPEVYSAVLEQGVAKERDRVTAHLTLGDASGDMKTAIAAINDGAEMTQTITAKYLAAGINRADRTARQTDSETAGAAADNAKPVAVAKDLGDEVVALMESERKGKVAV